MKEGTNPDNYKRASDRLSMMADGLFYNEETKQALKMGSKALLMSYEFAKINNIE